MSLALALSSLASIVSFFFAAFVFVQWRSRRQAYQLVWTVGLVLYGIGAGADALALLVGWNEALYRTWYLAGAFGVAAYLGLGTVFLLNRTRFGYFVAFSLAAGGLIGLAYAAARLREGAELPGWEGPAVLAVSLAAAALVAIVTHRARAAMAPTVAVILVTASVLVVVLGLTVPVDAPGYAVNAETGGPVGDAFPYALRVLTPPFNVTGAFALVFGAVYSAYIFMPKRRLLRPPEEPLFVSFMGRGLAVPVNFVASLPGAWSAFRQGRLNARVPATILIALGGFIPSWTSGLTRFGFGTAYYVGELLGVLFIFAGFLVSIEVWGAARQPARGPAAVRVDAPAGASAIVDSRHGEP